MKNRNSIERRKLKEILVKNAKLFKLEMIDKKENRFVIREDFHFFTRIENEIFTWNLQFTIDMATKGLIHLMMFLDPVIVTYETKTTYIEFANAANLYLGSALRRFWVNEDNDYCYECYLPDFLLEYEDELEKQLFDKPFSHFRDCLTPLMKMKNGE